MSGEYTFGVSDDIVRRIRENLPHIEWEQPLSAERERLAAAEIERLRALADQLADTLRLVSNDSYMLPLDTDEAVTSALDTYEEARRG